MAAYNDKRLLAAASLVRHGSATVDVGTDHAYLPIYLYKSQITDKITACDINEKPLLQAKRALKENGLTEKIKLLQSNGLEKIEKADADDIIICGMGGELITQILKNCPFVIDDNHRFILQPMTHIELFREELYSNGYEIIEEIPVAMPPHYYTVMSVKFCGKSQSISPFFSLIGKINESNSPDKFEVLKDILKKQKVIANGLIKSHNQKDKAQVHLDLIAKLEEMFEK